MIYPFYQEIPYQSPLQIFAIFAENDAAIFLDSAQLMKNCGRYSFIAIDPFLKIMSKNGEIYINDEKIYDNPFQVLAKKIAQFPLQNHTGLPPFQGGVAGLFSYDLYQHLEKIHSQQIDDMQFPDLAVGFYDLVIAFDHEFKKAWIFSSGYPEQQLQQREQHAQQRCHDLLSKINDRQDKISSSVFCGEEEKYSLSSNFSREEYCNAVQKVKEYILAGDIFEANISQRFSGYLPKSLRPLKLYKTLRTVNPAPFSAFVSFADTIIISASPERFLRLTQGQVEARPIKGTRARGKTVSEDQALAQELMQSEKDHAENVMIVDLLRNDLSRVCEDHSVQVPQLCGLESYATVHHLVSVVTGKLRSQFNANDLLCATFPGGSITGAPKIRAMEIIAEIEPTQRGPYCGSVGYIGFNGDMDLSIVIRTFAIKNNRITCQAGGAVVLDSDPDSEYEETLTKSSVLRKVLSDPESEFEETLTKSSVEKSFV